MHQQRKDPLEGATVDGRYVVESRLARGGMSTVYVATDRRLDRRVALKVLYPHLTDEPGFIDRFEQEAKSAARLSHPHVVGVLDQGVDEVAGQTVAYLVMEFVQGRTLRDLLREHGRLTPRRALLLLDAVLEGLAAAHDAGLIHRDVKPENVLLSDTGQVKIADFGLARAVSATTGTATLVGTVAYLSPELVLGRPAEAQSDIYSTGVMLYELLTGRQPFTGETPIQVALQHAQSDVPPPSVLLPGLPVDIDELVRWCTSRDPEERPVDGAALLGELRHIRTVLTDDELDFAPVGAPAAAPGQENLTAAVVPRVGGQRCDDGAGSPRAPDRDGTRADAGHGTARGVAGSGDRTEALPRSAAGDPRSFAAPSGATEVFRTSVLGRNHDATRVIGALPAVPPVPPVPSRPGAAPAARANGTPAARTARPMSKRQQSRRAQRPQQSLHGRATRRWVRALAVLLVLLAGLVATAGWFFGAGPAGIVSLPDVSRVPLEDARAALADRGLATVTTEEVFDDAVLAGLVVTTYPAASSEVRRFEHVALVVSRGPAPVAVPDVTGLTEAEATAALGRAGLTAVVADRREFSRTVPPGAVVGQNPAGPEAKRGTAVTLNLSRGPRRVDVPNVFSLPEDRAVTALEDAGFVVQVDHTFGGPVLGLVAWQSLRGEQPEGTTVRITVP